MTTLLMLSAVLALLGLALRSGSELTSEVLDMTPAELEAAASRESQDGHYPNIYSRELDRRAA